MLERLPQGNFGYVIAGLNTLFYFLYCIWPQHNMFSFMNNFTFSMFGLSRGYIHSLFTSHFTHMSFFSYLIDTVLCFLFCTNLGMMYGPTYVAKTCILSMLIGSLFVMLHQMSYSYQTRAFHGNDAIFRGLIFTLIFQNPQAQLMLFPIPVNIPAWAIAILLLGLDFLSFNTAAFGGVSAAWLMNAYF